MQSTDFDMDWTAIASQLHDELVSRITEEPQSAVKLARAVAMAGHLRQLAENSLREPSHPPLRPLSAAENRWNFGSEELRENRASNVISALRGADPRPGQKSDYRILGNTLQELNSSGAPSGSSVQLDDYRRIAGAFEALTNGDMQGRGPCKAKVLRELTSEGTVTAPLEPRSVSLTQVYVCLRFWLLLEGVNRHTGGTFTPTSPDGDFRETSSQLWNLVAEGGLNQRLLTQ